MIFKCECSAELFIPDSPCVFRQRLTSHYSSKSHLCYLVRAGMYDHAYIKEEFKKHKLNPSKLQKVLDDFDYLIKNPRKTRPRPKNYKTPPITKPIFKSKREKQIWYNASDEEDLSDTDIEEKKD